MHHKIQPCGNKNCKVYETIDVMKKAPLAIYGMKILLYHWFHSSFFSQEYCMKNRKEDDVPETLSWVISLGKGE